MKRNIIKEGPLVFLQELFLLEFLAFWGFYLIRFLGNYQELFQALGLTKLLRYEVFLVLMFSAFQVIYITAFFFHWYFSYYEIREKDIVRKTGIITRRKKSISLHDVVSIETKQSIINRLMNHADIHIEHRNGRTTKIRNVANFDEYVATIRDEIRLNDFSKNGIDIAKLVDMGESERLEFKATLRFDIRKNESSKDIEKSVLKSIAGFLNADGGTLLIGIDDSGNPVGLENDYRTLPKKNRDSFENYLTMLIKSMIGVHHTKHINVNFDKLSDKEICAVHVRPSRKPAYLKNHSDNREEFFVRVGNSTQPFSMSQAEEYIRTRF